MVYKTCIVTSKLKFALSDPQLTHCHVCQINPLLGGPTVFVELKANICALLLYDMYTVMWLA